MSNFPTSLDSLNNPSSGDNLNTAGVVHHTQHTDENDAIEALEAKVGVNGSAVTTSLDYKLANITASLSYAAPNLTLSTSNAAGAANTVMRSDAQLALFDATTPATSAVGDAGTVGTAVLAARRDHKHPREAFATPSIALAATAASGAATTLVRSDATIAAFDATPVSTASFADAATTGSAAFAAHRDHLHGMPTAGQATDTAQADLYIATTGSDSTGTGAIGAPFRTLAKALGQLPVNIGIAHTIHVADGTYAEGIDLRSYRSNVTAELKITGNTTTPANVIFTGTISLEIEDGSTFTCGAAISGPIWCELEGLTITITGDRGVFVQHGAHLNFDRSNVSGGAVGAAVNAASNGFVRFEGNCTLAGFTWTGLYVNEGGRANYAVTSGTLTITGAGSATNGILLHAGQCLVFSGTGFNITITNVGLGIGCGFGSSFSWQAASSTISITNTSTPGSSKGIGSSDTSNFSCNQTVTLDHFTTGFSADSVSYIEATGTRNLTNLGANSAASQSAVVYLP